METGQKVDLIRNLRETLEERYDWADRDLILSEFGIGSLHTDFDDELSVIDVLRSAEPERLLDLAMYLWPDKESSPTGGAAADVERPRGPLLLFASHQSDHKILVSEVANELAIFGITLFVAHEAIHPDAEWQEEIIQTLGVADAGVAFLHKEFKPSDWCAQEMGWLLGRDVPVISLKFDIAPYGFMGSRQAIRAGTLSAKEIAEEILAVVLGRSELGRAAERSFCGAMRRARTFKETDRIWERLRERSGLNADDCHQLVEALEDNNQVYWANSPWDGGRNYVEVVAEFIRKQPGAAAVEERLKAVERMRA